jgi:hypothetical protein
MDLMESKANIESLLYLKDRMFNIEDYMKKIED